MFSERKRAIDAYNTAVSPGQNGELKATSLATYVICLIDLRLQLRYILPTNTFGTMAVVPSSALCHSFLLNLNKGLPSTSLPTGIQTSSSEIGVSDLN